MRVVRVVIAPTYFSPLVRRVAVELFHRSSHFLGAHNPSREQTPSGETFQTMGLADDFAKVQLAAAAATKDIVQGPRLGAPHAPTPSLIV